LYEFLKSMRTTTKHASHDNYLVTRVEPNFTETNLGKQGGFTVIQVLYCARLAAKALGMELRFGYLRD
jgi:hypothetical protein